MRADRLQALPGFPPMRREQQEIVHVSGGSAVYAGLPSVLPEGETRVKV